MSYTTIGLPSTKQPRIFLLPHVGGKDLARVKLTLPHPEADHAVAKGPCPLCGIEEDDGFSVAGHGRRMSADDRAYEADASTTCCKAYVGTIRYEVDTLFGVREDAAVLTHARYRVY